LGDCALCKTDDDPRSKLTRLVNTACALIFA